MLLHEQSSMPYGKRGTRRVGDVKQNSISCFTVACAKADAAPTCCVPKWNPATIAPATPVALPGRRPARLLRWNLDRIEDNGHQAESDANGKAIAKFLRFPAVPSSAGGWPSFSMAVKLSFFFFSSQSPVYGSEQQAPKTSLNNPPILLGSTSKKSQASPTIPAVFLAATRVPLVCPLQTFFASCCPRFVQE